MNKTAIIIFIGLFLSNNIFGQNIVVSGLVNDSISKEPLIGANIYIEEMFIGTITNGYGYFSLTVPEKYQHKKVIISYTGYHSQSYEISTKNDGLQFFMQKGIDIKEVEVLYKKGFEERPNMSMFHIPLNEIKFMPQLFQEDLIKSIQLLPGIQGGSEGSAGMYVRGGNIDQNLVLLDDVPLYYVNHVGNMVSTFDNNTIKEFSLYKGAFPARYGGRLSSVLDVRMKEGDKSNFHGEVGIGILSGNVFLEGPIVKDKASFFISYRRFWPEFILSLASDNTFRYNFDDLSAKISADITARDKLMFSFYRGSDNMNSQECTPADDYYATALMNWSNMLGSVKYTRIISDKIFADFTTYFTRYNYRNNYYMYYKTDNDSVNLSTVKYSSLVSDISTKLELNYYASSKLSFKTGGQVIYHRYLPGASSYNIDNASDFISTANFDEIFAYEPSVFVETNYSPNKNVELNVGLRNSYYCIDGKNNPSIEPRASIRYTIDNLFTLKASYGHMVQTIHLLNYSASGMPNDLWIPPAKNLKPGKSKQMAVGAYKGLSKGMYEISIEGYYKQMENLVAYIDGASFFTGNEDWQDKLENNGTGTSKGVELFLQKKRGDLTGWVSYTLSKTDRHFENKNNGNPYPFTYDRRHDFSFVGNYHINKKLVFSTTWVFGSGYPITLAYSVYDTPWQHSKYTDNIKTGFFDKRMEADNYGGINAVRMENYHRLDVALTYQRQRKKTERIWNFSIYNVYNRQNPLYYFYLGHKRKLMKQSLFPILPSVSYTVKF
ncbi:MAG TPA: TonB-dependent receptor [Prolixibacteraceae bacterium]|nr:TonB-dependent receptor [Prolixibacteraceae bacterium]